MWSSFLRRLEVARNQITQISHQAFEGSALATLPGVMQAKALQAKPSRSESQWPVLLGKFGANWRVGLHHPARGWDIADGP
jgi:hypothetical protein